MNCKQGDLAIVIYSEQGNEGKIVQCISIIPDFNWKRMGRCPTWMVEPSLHTTDPRSRNAIPDAFLRPLRDPGDDAKDEMLRPLPKELEKA